MKPILPAVLIALFVCAEASSQPVDPALKLHKQLQSKNADTRADALVALAELGPKAAPAVDALARILPGVHEEERILATFALGKIGKPALPAVEKLLAHEDETTRYYAVWTIALIGRDARGLTPRLLNMLATDEDEEVRVKSAYALARLAPESKDLLAAFTRLALNKDRSAERLIAIEELRHCGPGAIEPLVRVLLAEHQVFGQNLLDNRAMALMMMNAVAPGPQTTATESLHHLLDNDKSDAFARTALRRVPDLLTLLPPPLPGQTNVEDGLTRLLSKHGEKLLPELEAKLRDKKSDAFLPALATLGQIASRLHQQNENPALVTRTMKLLVPFLKDSNEFVRQTAAFDTPFTDDSKSAFEALIFDENSLVRHTVFTKILQSGHDPMSKVLEKFQAAKGEERLRLALAFYQGRDPDMDGLLIDNLNHKDAGMRHRIACALAPQRILLADEVTKKMIAILLESLQSAKEEQRGEAALALLQCNPGKLRTLVPALLERLDDPSPLVRSNLLQIIGVHDYGADARATVKKLLPNLDDADETIRLQAVLLLTPLHQQGVPHLARVAEKDPAPAVWQQACTQLANVRPRAKDAIPALLRMAADEKRAPAALNALAEIDHDGTFLPLLELQMKRDESLRRALTLPKTKLEKSGALLDALLQDSKQADVSRRRDLAHTLVAVLPMLPIRMREEAVFKITRQLPRLVAATEKDLQAKDIKVRREAALALVELRKVDQALLALAPNPTGKEKELAILFEDRGQLALRFEKLIRIARTDADLRVRRAGRKAEALTDGQAAQFFPGLFSPIPWANPFLANPFMPFAPPGHMNDFDPHRIAVPLLPGGFGPSGFGPGISIAKILGPAA